MKAKQSLRTGTPVLIFMALAVSVGLGITSGPANIAVNNNTSIALPSADFIADIQNVGNSNTAPVLGALSNPPNYFYAELLNLGAGVDAIVVIGGTDAIRLSSTGIPWTFLKPMGTVQVRGDGEPVQLKIAAA